LKVLIIDDDPEMLDALAVGFRFRWPTGTILTATSGERGLELFREQRPDLVVTDLTMPGTDGFQVVREIRRMAADVPLVLVTGRSDDVDQQHGFVLGADDYVVKPFSVLTLLARINALLRRAGRQETSGPQTLVAGDLRIDPTNRQVTLAGNLVPLTPREYSLLHYLVRNPGRLLSHSELLETIWGSSWGATARDLKSLVSRLRAKIGDDPQRPSYIFTERGLGYRFVRANYAGQNAADEVVR
jgi:DNA-binding response OmpR family regulator